MPPYDNKGRFVSRKCPDGNCGGELVPDTFHGSPAWRCNGLTYSTDTGPLEACAYMHIDGEPKERTDGR